mgnify:CR=1 FL=1
MAIITGFTTWAQSYPLYSILIVSFLITLITTLIYKYFSDQSTIKRLRDEIKTLQNELKNIKDNPKKIMEKQKVIMEKNLTVMKHSLKPTLYTMIPVLLLFVWLKNLYVNTGAVLFSLSWFWAYVIFSFIFSLIIRKVLKVY